MPIVDMTFEDGVFSAREVGRVDAADALEWARRLAQHTDASKTPVLALIDAREVTYIVQDARKVFVRAANLPNFKAAAVVIADPVAEQTARIIGMMSPRDHTRVFNTMDDARRFIDAQLGRAAAR
jgi:anti-anti-sigma regulatory factor